MFTFKHTTEETFDVAPTNLPTGARLLPNKNAKGKYVVHIDEALTVPETTDELRLVAGKEEATIEINLGGTKRKVTEACKRYIVGRKLESNQDQHQLLAGDGKRSVRGDAMAWWSTQPDQTEVLKSNFVRSIKEPAFAKVLNAKLDRISGFLAAGDEASARTEIGL